MASYVGRYADYYDLIYAEKPYADEARFVHEQIGRHSQGDTTTLLELACGTGRHALELEKLGYQILATDYSEDLLRVAQQKAKKAGSNVEFHLQDMRELALSSENFDAAYCLFDSIGYVQTNAAVRKVLEGVRRHVRPGGLFIFEFWHAAAMLCGFEPLRERRWKTAEGELVRTSSTKLDIAKQLAVVNYVLEEYGPRGLVHRLEETQTNRFFLVQEMANFLEGAHFELKAFLSAYENKPVGGDTWHVLGIARRPV